MDNILLWMTLPVIAALIGWFTNFLAVRMIFRPYREFRFLGIKIQGLLPKRKAEFARSIGSTVEQHLISSEDIGKMLQDPEVSKKLKGSIEARIDNFIANKLSGGNPMIQAFLKGPMLDSMKVKLLVEVEDLLEDGVKMIGTHIDDNLDMRGIVEEKILSFDMHKLEEIVLEVAKKELVAIEILGAILGFVVGLVQLAFLFMIG
ncbi:MAG: uncharacterized membrane protein YheB (UPF0754 family) [Planctomycetota bacterium]|jgi:uncharacterized membrane protein YheB (UPF0754 family)